MSKLWPGKKGSATSDSKSSQSLDSGTISAAEYRPPLSPDLLHVINEKEENLPSPPSLPSLEYLLGKRPTNLRSKGHASRVQSSSQDVKYNERNSDRDSDHSSVSYTQDNQNLQQKKKVKKKRRRSSKEADEFDWQYNKLTVPQSSPPRERKVLARKLTPHPAESVFPGQRKLSSAFDDVSRELEMGVSADSAPFLSSLRSPFPESPHDSQKISSSSLNYGHPPPNCTTPLLYPNQQIKLEINELSKSPHAVSKKTTPISVKESSRKASTRPQKIESKDQKPGPFTANSITTSLSTPPNIMRQLASPTGHYPSLINDVGVQV